MSAIHPANKIYVSGHRGMVGSAVCRTLRRQGFENILTVGRENLDLTDQRAVFDFFAAEKPEVQVVCAAVVGGIVANDSYPGDFIGRNLMIQTNLLEAARRFSCAKTLFVASSCIYPRDTAQPMHEEQLLSGALEPTNQWYAVAKLAGMKMGQAYRRQFGLDITSVLPTSLYGPGDNFGWESSHVIPGIMRKLHAAKLSNAAAATIWGTGRVRREFMHVDDLADALVFLMRQEALPEFINIAYGEDLSINDLALLIKKTVGFEGQLQYDQTQPNGPKRKLLASDKLFGLGWRPRISLEKGLADTYAWFLKNTEQLREVHPDTGRA